MGGGDVQDRGGDGRTGVAWRRFEHQLGGLADLAELLDDLRLVADAGDDHRVEQARNPGEALNGFLE